MLHSDRDNAENPAYANARQVMIALSGAFKKLNLYSESHSVYTNALITLRNSLEQHFSRFGNLNIRICRNQILCDDEVVYQGSAEPADLVFILHRDGILSFEFQEGLELWELDTLLKILHDHCTLADDAEDDIVTALWKYNLPSILYEAADAELGLPDETRLFHQQGETHEGEEEEEENSAAAETEADMTNDDPQAVAAVSPLEHRNELFHLTPDEREQLRKMVFFEEQLDNTDYVVDVLLYILEQHCLPEDVEDLLGTLSQELGHALSKGRFAYLHAAIIKLARRISLVSAPYGTISQVTVRPLFPGPPAGALFLDRRRPSGVDERAEKVVVAAGQQLHRYPGSDDAADPIRRVAACPARNHCLHGRPRFFAFGKIDL
jgi:hypothetical protein